ncbi:MAG: hypothetical protein JJT93_06255 [Gammaproteobacteria bacterium]|nr:hypothetical protein [Gammaproteobacteria bacterium]TVQ48245.1 MAG: hypothetical protein EA371_06120 [Gammaproteobacteria bacterium]
MIRLKSLMARAGAVVVAASTLAACAGVPCERPERYAGAPSGAPLQIPEGFTPPDQSRALRIPPQPVEEPRRVSRRGPCLESPPDFFDQPLIER